MILNTLNAFDRKRAEVYFHKLITKRAVIELNEKRKSVVSEDELRTKQQNRTIHMWFAVVADDLGYTSAKDCKRDIKRAILGQKEYFNAITKKVELKDYETHLMSISELTNFMNKFKIWAQTEFGIYLPYYKDAGYEEMCQMYKNR